MHNMNLFIHIPKNAGMTIRRSPELMSQIVTAGTKLHKSKNYSASVKHKMDSLGDHHGFEHARYRDLNQPLVSTMRAFAVVRNPWDRVVSRYFFAKKVIEVEKKVDKSYADVSSFEAFLEERHKWGNEKYMWHRAIRGWYPAFDYVVDDSNTVCCDILRFEKMDDDLVSYFNLLSPPNRRNVTALNKGSYKDLYNEKTIQIIGDWYKKDIDYWGYDFDSGPTRNYWSND